MSVVVVVEEGWSKKEMEVVDCSVCAGQVCVFWKPQPRKPKRAFRAWRVLDAAQCFKERQAFGRRWVDSCLHVHTGP